MPTQHRTERLRFVAATHRDLGAMVDEGRFREDLLFRLDGVTVVVPPLRQRRDEIAALAAGFVSQFCSRSERSVPSIAPSTLEVLVRHDWPGNVRELRKVIERAVVLCRGREILPEHLRLGRAGKMGSRARDDPSDGSLFERSQARRDELERAAVIAALEATQRNQTRAAKRLGISGRALIDRIERYGLPRPRKD